MGWRASQCHRHCGASVPVHLIEHFSTQSLDEGSPLKSQGIARGCAPRPPPAASWPPPAPAPPPPSHSQHSVLKSQGLRTSPSSCRFLAASSFCSASFSRWAARSCSYASTYLRARWAVGAQQAAQDRADWSNTATQRLPPSVLPRKERPKRALPRCKHLLLLLERLLQGRQLSLGAHLVSLF